MPKNKKVYVVEYIEDLSYYKKEVFDDLQEAMLFVKLNGMKLNERNQECINVYECEVVTRDGVEYFIVINKIIFK